MSKRLQLLCGSFFFAVMFAYLGITTYSAYVDLSRGYDGWTATRPSGNDWIILSVDASGPAAALHKGDIVVSINGVQPKDEPSIVNYAWRVSPGTSYKMVVERDGRPFEFTFNTVRRPFFQPFLLWVGVLSLKVIYPLIFLLPGFVLFLLKPGDKQAFLLALVLGTYFALNVYPLPNLPSWLLSIAVAARILGTLFWPAFFHFFLVFPERSRLLTRFPRFEFYLYLPYLIAILPFHAPNRYWSLFAPQLAWRTLPPFLGTMNFICVVLYVLAGVIALFFNYRQASPAARRKARVAVVGSGLGFVYIFLMLIREATPLGRTQGFREMSNLIGLFLLPLIPASFVYAIVRHKVIPISLIIRRGVRYVLVSRGSIWLEVVAVMVAVSVVLTYVFSRFRASGIVIGITSVGVGFAVWKITSRLHNKYLGPAIDRKFFRQAYDSQKIMADLADSLRSTTGLPQLCERVATKIQSALQAANVTILLRDDESGDYLGAYRCTYSFHNRIALPYPYDYRLPRNSAAIARLAESGQPIDLDGRDTQFRLQSENGSSGALSVEELEVLQKLESALLLPIVTKDGLMGVISVGSHLGDLPFSGDDKKLLLSVSGPTSLALENIRLIERMVEDARRHQELKAENEQRAKELEEARQLQLSMLPRQVPQLSYLEVAAYMKTATEVGGDYYDFYLDGDGTLTVAIGDATGHGLKAGTVVTATKSLFNHLAPTPDIAGVFHQMSLALKRMNLRSLFMAIMMVKVKAYEATIGSAGMPPALVYRANGGRVEEVFIKGVPLGSVTSYLYHEERVVLRPGDVLVLMSDGLPERFNSKGEILGYAKPLQILAAAAAGSPREIIDRFVEAGDEWAGGRPQDDDVTFVVLKVR